MKIDISKIAKLANLNLTSDETIKFTRQLSQVINYVDKLSEISFKSVTPKNSYHNLKNSTRQDEAGVSLSQNEALSGQKQKNNGYFKTKRIL